MMIILIAIGLFLLPFLFCACIISSKYSREEEKYGKFRKIQNVSKEDKAIYRIHIRAFNDILRAIKKRKYKKSPY